MKERHHRSHLELAGTTLLVGYMVLSKETHELIARALAAIRMGDQQVELARALSEQHKELVGAVNRTRHDIRQLYRADYDEDPSTHC